MTRLSEVERRHFWVCRSTRSMPPRLRRYYRAVSRGKLRAAVAAAGLILTGCSDIESRRTATFNSCIEHVADAYGCAEAVDRLHPRPKGQTR